MSSTHIVDLQRAKRAVFHIAGTANYNYTLTFRADDHEEIISWADSSFNSGEGDRENKYGYCFQLIISSGIFIAVRKLSTLVAQSSTKAEFYCLAEACRELL